MSRRAKKQKSYVESDDEDAQFEVVKRQKKQPQSSQKKKLRRNDQEDEYDPVKEEESVHMNDFIVDADEEEEEVPKKKKISRNTKNTSSKPPRKQPQSKKKDTVKKEEDEEEENQNYGREIDLQMNNFTSEILKEMEARLPSYLHPERIRDEQLHKPDHPDYDPSTLHIPIADYQKLSPMFKQYWNAKKKNFDKIVFFRFGRWFHTFYQDALLIGQICNCRIGFWGADRPCLQIYDSQYSIFGRGLLERGHKILVIEQIERGELIQKESKDRIVKREITQIISKGTFLPDELSYEPRNIMALIQDGKNISLAVVDVTTNHFSIDCFEDLNTLRTLIIKMRPLELIILEDYIQSQTLKMIKHICNPEVIQTRREFKDMQFIFRQFKKEFMEEESSKKRASSKIFSGIKVPEPFEDIKLDINEGIYEESKQQSESNQKTQLSEDYPQLLQDLEKQYNHEENQLKKSNHDKIEEKSFYTYYYQTQSLYLLLHYLRTLMESETIYRRGTFEFLDSSFTLMKHLHLDSQSLESLEVFQVNLQTKLTEKGSLFHYINQCGSSFGRRLLRQWLCSPLFNNAHLMQRQQAVQDLKQVGQEFVSRIKSLPDIERLVVKVFNSISTQRLKAVAISGETFGQKRLKELSNLLKNLKDAFELRNVFTRFEFRNSRLNQLITVKNKKNNGLFPDISVALEELEKCLVFKEGHPSPAIGVSEEYDTAKQNYDEVLQKLDDELHYWRKELKCHDIHYFHGRGKFQLEIPDRFIEGNKKPAEFTITSKKKDFQRFQTDKIEDLILSLKIADDKLYRSLVPFLVEYFQKFYSQRQLWFQLVACLAELDCLQQQQQFKIMRSSLAITCNSMKPSCVPVPLELKPDEETQERTFDLKGAVHPCLTKQDGKWVPNDIHFNAHIDALLLTGPNMSGKSTILRLAAVCIILAQIGCSVPAESFSFVPFDRIFCRLGASDRLLEGKSTFFLEMEETKNILDACSARSLVIIDELGRGTSTYDGVAIASAVLSSLTTYIKPKLIFATHYHILLDEFALCKNIRQCVMKHDYDGHEVKFHYILMEGFSERSFAANVARIAGIPNQVVQRSLIVANKITKEEEKMTMSRQIIQDYNKNIIELLK